MYTGEKSNISIALTTAEWLCQIMNIKRPSLHRFLFLLANLPLMPFAVDANYTCCKSYWEMILATLWQIHTSYHFPMLAYHASLHR